MTEVQRSGLVSPGWHAIPPMGWEWRVPHLGAGTNHSKLAQWVERRSKTPFVAGSTPALAATSKWLSLTTVSGRRDPHRGASRHPGVSSPEMQRARRHVSSGERRGAPRQRPVGRAVALRGTARQRGGASARGVVIPPTRERAWGAPRPI